MRRHHVVVLVPRADGGWRAHFPDFPGCRSEGESAENAIHKAELAIAAFIAELRRTGRRVPAAKPYEAVRADEAWTRERGIEWSKAVISLVPIEEGEQTTSVP